MDTSAPFRRRCVASSAHSLWMAGAAVGLVLLAGHVSAEATEPAGAPASGDDVEEIVVYGRAEPQIGIANAASEGRVGYADLELRPIARVGELLEAVPGLIATQHSGPGKSNQLFLRGFNLDHGTDFAVFFDAVPVNFRTHGHGQGYLDLNFVIPELVETIDFRKGPYRADVGDFSSAGASFFRTFDQLPDSIASATVGEDRYLRGLVAANLPSEIGDVLVALESKTYDDPYDLDANVFHLNGFAKLTRDLGAGTLRVSALGYHADWNSTDQVPRRAIEDNLIGRLGLIDPDLGGRTTRVGLTVQWEGEGPRGLALSSYLLYYDLDLYSNFTYFLDNPPPDGDEFRQQDERIVWGAAGSYEWGLFDGAVSLLVGSDTRLDAITQVGLARTTSRHVFDVVREDAVTEWSGALWAEARGSSTEWLRWMLGVRGDLYVFDIDTAKGIGARANDGTEADAIVGPKLALSVRPHEDLELYLSGGGGFHSNDARGATLRIDPSDGTAAQEVDPLAQSWGTEVGARWQPDARYHTTLVAWLLRAESELVFVGDAGTTEAQGASLRYGVEIVGFARPVDWIAFDAAWALSHSEFTSLPSGRDRIPGAIENVLSAGATLTAGRWSGSIRLRHFGAYALDEANSQRAESTTLVNLGAQYAWGPLTLGIAVFNLFDARDSDIEYFFASQLAGELSPVEDVHLHPVPPRQVRGTLTLRF